MAEYNESYKEHGEAPVFAGRETLEKYASYGAAPVAITVDGLAGQDVPYHLGIAIADTPKPYDVWNDYDGPLLTAEELPPAYLKDKIDGMPHKARIGNRETLASHYTELALAHPDGAESRTAFKKAVELYESILDEAPPTGELWLRTDRAFKMLSVMRMRREGYDPDEIAPVAYEALGASLAETLPYTRWEDDPQQANMARGIVAETSVAALLARSGRVPFLSSGREGSQTGPAAPFVSDLHLMENGHKVPIEVKYSAQGLKRIPYDSSQVLVVKYVDICRTADERVALPYAPVGAELTAAEISQDLADEAAGKPLLPSCKQLLDLGSQVLAETITAWQQGNDTTYRAAA